MCEAAFVGMQIILMVLFHYQIGIGQNQAFAGIFAFHMCIVSVLHAFYVPFFHLWVNRLRVGAMIAMCYFSTVLCIFDYNAQTPTASTSSNWNSLVLIVGTVLSFIFGLTMASIRVSRRCLAALNLASRGIRSAPKQGALFPSRLPVEELIGYREIESVILGQAKLARAQESLTGPQQGAGGDAR